MKSMMARKLTPAQERMLERFRSGDVVLTSGGCEPHAFWRQTMDRANLATLYALCRTGLITEVENDWRGATYVIAPEPAPTAPPAPPEA